MQRSSMVRFGKRSMEFEMQSNEKNIEDSE